MSEPLLIRARPAPWAVNALLDAVSLPASDLTEAHLEHFFFAGSDGSPTGLVGLELYGSDALLRSLVVVQFARNRGLGSSLVRHAESYARSRGVRAVYVLTTTAEPFFRQLGYERIDRSRAPASIKQTPEFACLCPASSAFMVKPLTSLGAL